MTLFIAETNDRIRQSLASLAACIEGIELVGEAGDVRDAIVGIKQARPDSVVVALQLSGGSGLDVLSAARSMNPAPHAILLTQGSCYEREHQYHALGADYVFAKSGEIKRIVTTLVYLAHRAYQRPLPGNREAFQRPVQSLPVPSESSHAFPSGESTPEVLFPFQDLIGDSTLCNL